MAIRGVSVKRALRRLVQEQRGATAIEYGLIASLIVITMIAGFIEVSRVTTGMWNNVSSSVRNASGGP